jgi:hypothetical protein
VLSCASNEVICSVVAQLTTQIILQASSVVSEQKALDCNVKLFHKKVTFFSGLFVKAEE